ncbi:MAG: hypothetical protein ACE5EF_10165 [Dehalococcoidia bacterium]
MATVRAAGGLVLRGPREILLPVAAIHIPLSVILASITLLASFTILRGEPLDPLAEDATRTLFLFLSTVGAWILFSQVARAAAVRAVAGVWREEDLSLPETLDPAFTRMGGLIALALLLFAVAAIAVIPFAGWILAPYLTLRMSLAFDALILEDVPPFQAVRRSWELTRGRLLRLLGVLGLGSLSLLLPLAVLSLLGLAVTGSRTQQILAGAGYSITQGILTIPVVAFITACGTTFYLQAIGTLDVRSDV